MGTHKCFDDVFLVSLISGWVLLVIKPTDLKFKIFPFEIEIKKLSTNKKEYHANRESENQLFLNPKRKHNLKNLQKKY